ncbi:MAG: alpha/beta fold hydrolase [Pseudomonadota bacterium]
MRIALPLLRALLLPAILLVCPLALADSLRIKPYTFEAGGEQGSVEAEWGEFEVPARHDDPDGERLTLAFVRFPSTNPKPGHPIVYLAGGPGGSGIGTARGGRFPLFMALREVADVIAFDQRGTGASSPGPTCRYPDAYDLAQPDTRENGVAYVQAAARWCLDWWTEEGFNIGIFNTRESARDLEALRRVLGAEKLNLWGISYGTHLALDAFRVLGPDAVHRAVLASPEGLAQTVKRPAFSERYFERVAALAKDRYPDFLPTLHGQLERLAREPESVTFTPQGASEPITMNVGATTYRALIAFAMVKNPQNVAGLPQLVQGVEAMGMQVVAPFALRMFGEPMTLRPMSFGMDVASGISPERLAEVMAQADTAVVGDMMNFPLPHVLGVPGLPDLGDAFRQEVESPIATLVLTGTLDGRTFPEAHAEILSGLSNGSQITIENAGHDLFMVSDEVQQAVVRYFGDGSVAESTITIPPPTFR